MTLTPLPTLERYLLRQFLTAFFGSVVFFSGMFIIVTLSQDLAWFIQISPRVPFNKYVLYFLYRIPFWLTYTYPLSALYATVFVLGRMNAENQIIGIFNAGRSLDRVLWPVFLFLFLVSSVILIWDKELIYGPNQKFRAILQEMRDPTKLEFEGPRVRDHLTVFGADNKIYFIRRYHQTNAVLQDTQILWMDKQMNFVKLVSANWIRWQSPTGWVADEALVREFADLSNKLPMRTTRVRQMPLPLQETPFHFEESYERLELLSTRETLRLAKKYETIGGDYRHWNVEYYAKTATPFMALVIAFFGVPLSIFTRRSAMVLSFLLVLLATFIFYVLNQIGMSLGKWGAFPPWMAGWFGNIGFLVLGVILRRRFRF